MIGVGHSLGRVITLLAALRRPQAFAPWCCWMRRFQSWRRRLILAGANCGANRTHHPGRRRRGSPRLSRDADSAVRAFAGKALFAEFSPQALRDYIEHGADASEHGVRLRFQPHRSKAGFSPPCHSFAAYRGRLAVPRHMWRAAAAGDAPAMCALPAGVLA